jgi:hypothetical protein
VVSEVAGGAAESVTGMGNLHIQAFTGVRHHQSRRVRRERRRSRQRPCIRCHPPRRFCQGNS